MINSPALARPGTAAEPRGPVAAADTDSDAAVLLLLLPPLLLRQAFFGFYQNLLDPRFV